MNNKEIMEYPVIGATYKHYQGGTYTVMTLATEVDSKKPVVVYRSIEFGTVWTRYLDDWNSKVHVEQDGTNYKPSIGKRFTKIT